MKKAFTMMELIFVIVVVAIISTALLVSFISCLALNENSRMMTLAMNIARDKIERMIDNKSNWSSIASAFYNENDLFTAYSVHNFSCQVAVNSLAGDTIKLVRVVVCWRLNTARIVGTDNGDGSGTALNGVLDGGEHSVSWQGSNVLDSPVVLTTAILRTS